jgi:hypothetical protein
VLNTTFNSISVISWWSVNEEKLEYPEKTIDMSQTLSHDIVSSTPCPERGLNSQH